LVQGGLKKRPNYLNKFEHFASKILLPLHGS
jgi:hypothetical protein